MPWQRKRRNMSLATIKTWLERYGVDLHARSLGRRTQYDLDEISEWLGVYRKELLRKIGAETNFVDQTLWDEVLTRMAKGVTYSLRALADENMEKAAKGLRFSLKAYQEYAQAVKDLRRDELEEFMSVE